MASNYSKGAFAGILISLLIFFILFIISINPNLRSGPGFDCVDNPLNELTNKIVQAKTGRESMSQRICLLDGESFGTEHLQSRIPDLNSVTFYCMPNAAVCKDGKPLRVEGGFVEVTGHRAQFAAVINCVKSGSSTGDFDCTIEIRSPE